MGFEPPSRFCQELPWDNSASGRSEIPNGSTVWPKCSRLCLHEALPVLPFKTHHSCFTSLFIMHSDAEWGMFGVTLQPAPDFLTPEWPAMQLSEQIGERPRRNSLSYPFTDQWA